MMFPVRLRWASAALFALLAIGFGPAAQAQEAERVITGTLTRADHRQHRELTFSVPDDARRLIVEIDYERGTEWSAIDLALFDPERFRGASGFGKTRIEIGLFDATPSYLPGPLPAGEWTLVLGGANAPEGRETPYTVRIRFMRGDEASTASGFAGAAPRPGPDWYRGDFHVHTGHSDGRCASLSGVQVPCPVFRALEAAVERKLDFVAVTDHNTVSHFQSLAELQPYFDALTIIPAQEVTTYSGHLNVFGPREPIAFHMDGSSAPDLGPVYRRIAALRGVSSINHPGISLSTGCPGCGWSASGPDEGGPQAVEIVNGVTARWTEGAEGPDSSFPFWIARLNAGLKTTAIGGSDNHDPNITPEELSSVGGPTTVVRAASSSVADILEGVRAGHVFVDVEGSPDRLLTLTARAVGRQAEMGDTLTVPAGLGVEFEATVIAPPSGARLDILKDGQPLEGVLPALDADGVYRFSWPSDGQRHWIVVHVRAADGRLLLIGNPVYLNWELTI